MAIVTDAEMLGSDRHGSCPTKPNLTTPEIVEQFPSRTLSVSNTFLCPLPYASYMQHILFSCIGLFLLFFSQYIVIGRGG